VPQTNRNKSTFLEETDAVQIHSNTEKSIYMATSYTYLRHGMWCPQSILLNDIWQHEPKAIARVTYSIWRESEKKRRYITESEK